MSENIDFVQRIVTWIEDKQIFLRERKRKELFEESTKKKKRKWIAIDEKEIKLNGTTVFIWGAVDLDDEKVIAV